MLVAVVCAVLFTVLLGNNFIEEAPVAVIDLDNSKYSHELIQEMDASPYIDINTVFHSAVNPKALFYRDRFAAVVYFPKDLEKNLYSDAAGQIGVFYDNTSIAQNADIMEALNTIVAEENNKLSAPETSRAERGITLRDRLLFNPQGPAAFSFISPASSSSSASSSMGPGRKRNMHDGRSSAILVPVDGSEPSVRALEKAVYLAEKCGSQVTLLTVVDMNKEINSFEQVSTGGYVPGELKEKGYQILLKLMPSIPKEIHVQAVVQIGDPAKNIVQYSEDHPTDLIIIGNRGLSGLKKILLGSVSNYVLLRSQVPILIMK